MASISEEFEALLSNGKYIFHLHTDYTDGSSTVEDYFEYASLNGCKSIIFTEHVRRHTSYNFDAFLADIQTAGEKFPGIKTLAGAEARIFPDGDVDISEEVSSKIQVICFACHSFPADIELYKKSFKALVTDKRWNNHIRVWVHPGRFLRIHGILDRNTENISDLIRLAVQENVFIEKNIREGLPAPAILKSAPADRIVIGYDAHSVDELRTLQLSGSGDYFSE